MTYAENYDAYLADFGVDCMFGGTAFKAIHDAPDEFAAVGQVGAISAAHTITYRTDAVALAYGRPVTVAGASYVVHEVRAIDDGAFTRARIGPA